MRQPLVVLLIGFFGASAGCAGSSVRSQHMPGRVFLASSTGKSTPGPARKRGAISPDRPASAARLVERSLHERGIRFGTDGTMGSLYAFLSGRYQAVAPERAGSGDVVVFDLGDGAGCGSHLGVVETVDQGGRVSFREWRDGSNRHSFVSPAAPRVRRDDSGRVMNSFLRTKLPDDPDSTRYFAGEMFCSVLHVVQ